MPPVCFCVRDTTIALYQGASSHPASPLLLGPPEQAAHEPAALLGLRIGRHIVLRRAARPITTGEDAVPAGPPFIPRDTTGRRLPGCATGARPPETPVRHPSGPCSGGRWGWTVVPTAASHPPAGHSGRRLGPPCAASPLAHSSLIRSPLWVVMMPLQILMTPSPAS